MAFAFHESISRLKQPILGIRKTDDTEPRT